MNKTGKNIIKKIVSILIILFLNLTDFLFVGEGLVTYALNEARTNNSNVEFSAYFLDSNGEKHEEIEEDIDVQNLNLYVDVSVKNEGYFNGKIVVEDSNFSLKEENDSQDISEISENTVILNQINAGSTVTLSLGIEPIKNDLIDISTLSGKSKITIQGQYVNSKNVESEKFIDIKGTTNVELNWKSSKMSKINLEAKILTNAVHEIENEEKRVVQTLIKSGLNNNNYPIKSTKIELNVPEKVQDVKVFSRNNNSTNSNLIFSDDNFVYDKEKNTLTISLENTDEKSISWNKEGQDEFVVTYILDKEQNIDNTEIKIDASIITYDGKELNDETTVIVSENVDEIISLNLTSNEQAIFKGKIYTGEQRQYITNTAININYLDVVDSICIREDATKFLVNEQELDSSIVYTGIRIKKQEFLKLFSETGYITIQNQDDSIIANIDNELEADNDGIITINFPAETTSIKITTSKPIDLGTLNIENIKSILNTNLSRDEITTLTGIKEKITKIDNLQEITESKNIELKNTTSKASLSVSTDKLSTIEKNENVKITAILENNGEDKDLYQNSKIKIALPNQVTNVEAKCKLIYGNGLTLENPHVSKENGHYVIEADLVGTQSSYNAEAVEGTTLIIYATLDVDKLAVNSNEEITLNYTNEIATNIQDNGEQKVGINIVSTTGLITTNNVPEYDIETIGDKGTQKVLLDVSSAEKEIAVNISTINNEGTTIKDVKILGRFPIENDSTLAAELISEINILTENRGVNVYYSNNENPTTELNNANNNWEKAANTSTSRSYLITIDKMEVGEKFEAEYNLKIPANLVYNMKAEEGYEVTYTDEIESNEKTVKATTLSLTTGVGPEIESSLKAYVGGEELTNDSSVNVGEVIEYKLNVKNTGNENAENVNIEINIPNGTKAVKYVKSSEVEEDKDQETLRGTRDFYKELDVNNNKLTGTIGMLKVNEERTYTYELKVTDEALENNISSNANVTYKGSEETQNNVTKTTNTITNYVQTSDLDLSMIMIARGDKAMEAGKKYVYSLTVKNTSNKTVSNIKLETKLNSGYALDLILDESGEIIKFDNNTFTIQSIEAGKEKTYKVQVEATGKNDVATIAIIANDVYRSNEVREKITTRDLGLSMTSENDGATIKSGDSVIYNITVTNKEDKKIDYIEMTQDLSTYLEVSKITVNGEEIEYDTQYLSSEENTDNKSKNNEENTMEEGENYKVGFNYNKEINPGESVSMTVEASTDSELILSKDIHLLSVVEAKTSGISKKSDEVNHILRANENIADEEDDDEEENNTENGDNGNNENNNNNGENGKTKVDNKNEISTGGNSNNEGTSENKGKTDSAQKTYAISGTAWLDKNENGQRDSDEEKLSGIKVTLLDLQKNTTATAMTSESGFYSLTKVPNGSYIAIFEFDTEKYILTSYKADGVLDSRNSDVENVTININGEDKKVSSTDTIVVKDKDITNIDIGLAAAKTFDLELSKSITKVTISNENGIQTINYDDSKLAKAEIAAKHLSGSTVAVEYRIKVSNKGEIAGYAKNIVDYKPADLSFNSSLNKDWYQSGDYIYTTSLANTKLEAGESKELTLVLTKTMTETNTGLVNNTAEIQEDYNALAVADMDSTPGNRQKAEDDMSAADLIISVKTGAAVSYVSIVLSIIILLAIGTFMITKKVIKKDEIEF